MLEEKWRKRASVNQWMHKNTIEIRWKNCQTENANIWNWIGKGKNSEIQWKSCYSLLCARSNGKVVTACFVRDLFGSLLCLSLKEKTDMAEVLSYLLTPVPLSLSYSAGSMLSSPKSNLMKYLKTLQSQKR